MRLTQAATPQHLRTICLRPLGLMVITTSTFWPQNLQSCTACFDSWRAATFVFDFLPSPATSLLLRLLVAARLTARKVYQMHRTALLPVSFRTAADSRYTFPPAMETLGSC